MQTVTFFSFKGGVGRTYTMLNVAYEVARRGAFVVLADWDIHAPGLTVLPELSPPEVAQGKLAVRKGVVDYFESALYYLKHSKGRVLDPSSFVRPTQLASNAQRENRVLETHEHFQGDIHFIPAGRFQPNESSSTNEGKKADESYHEQLRNIPLNLLYTLKQEQRKDRSLLKNFVDSIARNVRSEVLGPDKAPDFLFIDCRTGLTELGDLTLDVISDHIVLVSGLNRQNLVGLESALDTIVPEVRFNEIRSYLTLVLSPVPFGEDELVKQSFQRVRELLRARLRRRGDEQEEKPEILRIPYHPRIALAGGILARDFPDAPPMQTYTQLATKLHRSKKDLEKTRVLTELEVRSITKGNDERLESTQPKQDNQSRPHPIAAMPAWNWFRPELHAQDILPAEKDPDKARRVVASLARSISISKEEKLQILKSYGTLGEEKVRELLRTLHDEQQEHLASPSWNYERLAFFVGQYVGEWLDIVSELQPEIDEVESIKEVVQDKNNESLGAIVRYATFWVGLSDWTTVKKAWLLCEAILQRAVGQEPNSTIVWNRLGNLYQEHLERYEEAEDCYKKAIECNPNYAATYNGMGNLYKDKLEKYEEAEDWYKRAIELEHYKGNLAIAYTNLGDLYKDYLERLKEAEDCYKKALEFNPNDATTYNSMGNLYQDFLERNDEAETAYQTAMDLDPTDGFPANNWTRLKLRLGDVQEAARLNQLARTLDPNEPAFLHVDGVISLAQGDEEKGYALIEQGAEGVKGKRYWQIELVRELLMIAPYIPGHEERLVDLANTYQRRFDLDEALLTKYRTKPKASS
ncbi:MAG: tetratricopeptide repeat protein [Deltaproteobacteria bacterium]|nr:MAG: tetratricopeptide repeat protein [Deltaproteobacteria bacterium]